MKYKNKKKVYTESTKARKHNKKKGKGNSARGTMEKTGEKVSKCSVEREKKGFDIFNRNKLTKIRMGLAADQKVATIATHDKGASIFNVERLQKITRGLKQVKDDDSDCCVVYNGPVVTTSKQNKRRRGTKRKDTTEEIGAPGPAKMQKSSKEHLPTSIFDKEKLNKICSGIRSYRDAIRADTSKNNLAKVKKTPPSLRDRMVERLNVARFRYINENFYKSSGAAAESFFKEDPEAFNAYHIGYRSQVRKWPMNPIDVIISEINELPKEKLIADFGCGDAKLAQSVCNKVYSFDLVALNKCVIACNMAKVPLANSSVDVAVFCLSLMGTNLADYVAEANRVLKIGGILKIADVESRFDNVDNFIHQLKKMGFTLLKKDMKHKMFVMLDFKKDSGCGRKRLPTIVLQACIYKKR